MSYLFIVLEKLARLFMGSFFGTPGHVRMKGGGARGSLDPPMAA